MRRREFLMGMMGLAVTGCNALRMLPEQGLFNPCLEYLPPDIADSSWLRTAWQGLDPAQVWDCHVHLAGVGDGATGIRINPAMDSLLHPLQYAQKRFYLNAGCVDRAGAGEVDAAYVRRLLALLNQAPADCKALLYAFDAAHDEMGYALWGKSAFYVPNSYVARVAHAYPQRFAWAASIHPYRGDAEQALSDAFTQGACAVKWLPAAQGIDPASSRCDAFYRALATHDLPLIVHAGAEGAVHGAGAPDLGNPLRLRRALDHGVRIVIAHCASDGEDDDLDRGSNGARVASFTLFARLMDDVNYKDLVYGDISALPQVNRAHYLPEILTRSDWHARLLNGSDYPLPGVMPLFSLRELVRLQLLDETAMPTLKKLRAHNAWLFDFVVKRHLRYQGQVFPTRVFETRRFFSRAAV